MLVKKLFVKLYIFVDDTCPQGSITGFFPSILMLYMPCQECDAITRRQVFRFPTQHIRQEISSS